MYRQILIDAKARIEQTRNNEIATLTNKLRTEKIAPFFAEIDKKKVEAIAQERETFNSEIMALQQRFDDRKKEYELAAEDQKRKFSDRIITTETASIVAKYSSAINNLERMIEEAGE
jgi:hypothetical protein